MTRTHHLVGPLLAAALLVAAVPCTGQQGERQRWAVVIGVSEYADPAILDLSFAADDARAFQAFLRSPAVGLGGIPASNIRLLLDGDATARNVRSALTSFLAQASPDDLILVFLSGHGSPDPYRPEDYYVLTHDTDADDISATAVAMAEIDAALRARPSYHTVVFMDVAHSGPVGRPGSTGMSRRRGVVVTEPRADDGHPFVAFTATDGAQHSREGEGWGGGHGVFTHFLLEGLAGAADHDADRIVTLGEAMEYTRDRVRRATRNAQVPAISATHFDRFLPLATVPADAPPADPVVRQRWAVVIGVGTTHASADARAFHDFLVSPAAGMGGFPADHVRLLTAEHATARGIRSALTTFLRSATPDDVILVFIAGHSTPDPARPEDLYLLAHDTDPAALPATAVPVRLLAEALADAYAYQIILFADAALPELTSPTERFAALNAAADGAPGLAGEEWNGGVFSHFLLRGLRGEADEDGDRVVTLQEVMEYTRDGVRRATGNEQVPTVSATSFDGFWPMGAISGPGG